MHDLLDGFGEDGSFGKILKEFRGLKIFFHEEEAPADNSVKIGEILEGNAVEKQRNDQIVIFSLAVNYKLTLLQILPCHFST